MRFEYTTVRGFQKAGSRTSIGYQYNDKYIKNYTLNGAGTLNYSKKYLQLTLKYIAAKVILNELIHEFGIDHPKVNQYKYKIDKLIDEKKAARRYN